MIAPIPLLRPEAPDAIDRHGRFSFGAPLRNFPIAVQLAMIVVSFGLILLILLSVSAVADRLGVATRAFTEGDRAWAHAQDQAIYSLALYLSSEEEADYRRFQNHLRVPFGDRLAREELEKPSFDPRVVQRGFLEGGLDPRDIPTMIWAFRHFSDLGPLAEANRAWTEGDRVTDELVALGTEVHADVIGERLDAKRRDELIDRFDDLNARLSQVEEVFAAKVSESERWVERASVVTIFLTGLLLFTAGVGVSWLIARHVGAAVRSLADGAARIARGDLSQPVAIRSRDELGNLAIAFNEMMSNRRQVEATLERDREVLRNVLENTQAVPWEMDANTGACTYVGPQVERQWGWLAACFEKPGFLLGCIHAEDRRAYGEALARLPFCSELELEFRLQRDDGSFMHIRSFLSHGTDSRSGRETVRAISIDVTKQIDLDQQLRLLNSLIEQMSLPFVSGGKDGRIMRANAAFARLTGYTIPELLRMRTRDLTPERWLAVDAERFRRMNETGQRMEGEKEYRRKDGSIVPIGFHSEPYRDAMGEVVGLYAFVWDVTENKRKAAEVERIQSELRESEERLRAAFECSAIGIILMTAERQVLRANRAACSILGYSEAELQAPRRSRLTHPDEFEKEAVLRVRLLAGEIPTFSVEWRQFHKSGELIWTRSTVSLARAATGEILHLIYEIEDITARKRVEAELQSAGEQQKKLELELQQAQKLEAVGRLAAGVAHEINTPVQFVNDSCHFLRDGLADLQKLLVTYRDSLEAVADGRVVAEAAVREAREAEQALDLDYLMDNMPGAVDRSLEGLERVATIVRSMKEFAHPDQKEKVHADLNQAIKSTLVIARNEYKYVADLETDLGDLPPVSCFLSELNQAVLNIVINASHAIADAVQGTERRGLIRIRTRHEGAFVTIAISDSGTGIPESIRCKIFDPFFTTKEVGKGTGQGLAIAHSVVVGKHQGAISVESAPGQGTTFLLRLPVESGVPVPALAA